MAANFNKVILMGNLTADPELRTTPKGNSVTDIRMAINRYVSSNNSPDGTNSRTEETVFVDVTLWGRQAQFACDYARKGSAVFIEGRLQFDTWEDRQSGQRRSRLYVIGENIQLLTPRNSGATAGVPRSDYSPQRQGFGGGTNNYSSPEASRQTSTSNESGSGFYSNTNQSQADNFDDDDIPF